MLYTDLASVTSRSHLRLGKAVLTDERIMCSKSVLSTYDLNRVEDERIMCSKSVLSTYDLKLSG